MTMDRGGRPAKSRILILDAHSNAALAVLQSLGRAGYRVALAGAAPDGMAAASRYAGTMLRYPDPLESRERFEEWIAGVASSGRFDWIVPVTDSTMTPLMALRESPEVRYLLPGRASFELFFNKALTIGLAQDLCIPVPPSRLLSGPSWDPAAFVNFPYFVKPARSKVWIGDRGFNLSARLARTREELSRHVEHALGFGEVLVQEYAPGGGVGVEVLCKGGTILGHFGHRRIHESPLTGGGSSYRVSIAVPPRLLEDAEKLMAAARWDGPAMVEFKCSGSVYSLMEVNGRFWGSLPLSLHAGVDFPRYALELADGGRPAFNSHYRLGRYSRKVGADVAWFKQNLRADKHDRLLMTRPVLKTVVEWGRLLTGRDRWDHASFDDPGPILREIGQTLVHEFAQLRSRAEKRLRQSLVRRSSVRAVRRLRPKTLLIVSRENLCRSPFAQRLLCRTLDGGSHAVASCGGGTEAGRKSPEDFVHLAREFGVDLGDHRSRPITRELVDWAECIVIMDDTDRAALAAFGDSVSGKVVWLGAFGRQGECGDAGGNADAQGRETLRAIEGACEKLADELVSDR